MSMDRVTPAMVKSQRKTALFLALVGSIPLFVGKKLRQLVYRRLVGSLGHNVSFEVGIELAGAKGIAIGNNCQIWTNVSLNCWTPDSQIVLHDSVVIDRGTYLQPIGGCIEVKEHSYIGPYFCAAGPADIKIGKNCMIAAHSSMYANNHIFDDPDIPINQQGVTCKGITIEDDCWLGTGVRVLDGVTIGKGSIVGAGAVVTKSIPPYSVAVGVPARVISSRRKTAALTAK
ncbi:MAG: hypothetical protein Kow00121_25190 [Elainellaceae cyanobacterium]